MKLFDKNGAAVDVPDEQAQDALQSGEYGLPQGAKVPVKLSDGTVGSVPFEHLQTALTGGAQIVSDKAYQDAALQAQYGDLKHAALAGATGALRGASFGLSDAAIRGIGGRDAAETVRKSGEANPVASGGGEVFGALAPIALTGGAAAPEVAGAEEASLLGRAASGAGDVLSAPYNAASHFGEAAATASRELAGMVTKSPTAARVLGTLTKGAAEGALLGGAQGAGDAISEASLGDANLNAEMLAAHIGHGALLGAGGGALLNGAGELTKTIVGSAAKHLDGLAGEQAFRSLLTSSDKKVVRLAEKIPGGSKAIGQRMLDDGVISLGDSVDEIAPKVAREKDAAGKGVTEILQKADESGFAGPNIGKVLRGMEKQVLPRLDALPSLNSGAISRVQDLANDIASFAGMGESGALRTTFEQAQALRGRIDDAIKWTTPGIGAPANELNDSLIKTRGILETEIEDAGDKAAKKLGGSFLDEYKAQKLKYRQYAVADAAVQEAVTRKTANRAMSPTDYLSGLAGAALESGHPMGMLAGLAGAMAHHVVRERGNATAAVILDKLAGLQAVKRGVSSAEEAMDREVAKIVSPSTHAPEPVRPALSHGERVTAVQRSVSHPEQHAERVQQVIEAIAQHAPQTAAAFQATAERATSFLQKAAPVPPVHNPLLSTAKDTEPPKDQQAKFSRVYSAVHEPPSVLRSVARGMVTQDQIDALRATRPLWLKSAQDKVQRSLMARPVHLPLQKRIAISTFLGVPLEPLLMPEHAQALQASWLTPAKQEQGPNKPPGRPHSKPLSTDFSKSLSLKGN